MKANIQIKRGTYIKSLNTKTTLKTLKHSNSIMAPPPLSVLRPLKQKKERPEVSNIFDRSQMK